MLGIGHRRAPAVARDKHSQDAVPTSTAPVIRIPARLLNFEPPDLGTVLITVQNSQYRAHTRNAAATGRTLGRCTRLRRRSSSRVQERFQLEKAFSKAKVIARRVPLLTAFGARAAVALESTERDQFICIREPFVTPCVELAIDVPSTRRSIAKLGGVTGSGHKIRSASVEARAAC